MKRLLAYLQLFRLPNVFTAMADVCMGFLVSRGSVQPWGDFALLLVASSCIYLAGLALNDWFDIEVDRRERPDRPLPSGRVPRSHALVSGVALLVVGVVAATLVGATSRNVAALLVVSVLLYDGVLKNTYFGPIVMGLCRALNVLLGLSSVAGSIWLFDQGEPPAWRFGTMVAAGVGLYIMGVTRFAQRETTSASVPNTTASALGFNFGLLLIAMAAHTSFARNALGASPTDPYWLLADSDPEAWARRVRLYSATALWAAVVIVTNAMVWRGMAQGQPRAIQQAVKTCIVSLIVLDASVVALVNGPVWAAALLLLLVPTLTLGRWVYST